MRIYFSRFEIFDSLALGQPDRAVTLLAMRHARRQDLSPRIEIMPLIDVIFLLLTFFIYSLVTMVQAEVLPVGLTALRTGEQAEPADYAAITVDRSGQLYFDREPIAPDALKARLEKLARQNEPPRLLLAMQGAQSDGPAPEPVDRGPVLIELIEQVREAGLTDFAIVGRPRE
jgi:biopolymer transport protein ExbD